VHLAVIVTPTVAHVWDMAPLDGRRPAALDGTLRVAIVLDVPATAPIVTVSGSSSSLVLISTADTLVRGASGMTQAYTAQPPTLAGVDYPHDPHLTIIDGGTAALLAVAVAGVVLHERFFFAANLDRGSPTRPSGRPDREARATQPRNRSP
jgi:hypothetical protein